MFGRVKDGRSGVVSAEERRRDGTQCAAERKDAETDHETCLRAHPVRERGSGCRRSAVFAKRAGKEFMPSILGRTRSTLQDL
jgi:hypothetical protein